MFKNTALLRSVGIVAFGVLASPVAADKIDNAEAVIPPQCYTQTEGQFNPCYVCHQTHQNSERRNGMLDGSLQAAYAFSDTGETNYWRNLFTPPSPVEWSSGQVNAWVNHDNYSALYNPAPPQHYDEIKGTVAYTPDLKNYADYRLAFDKQGIATDGSGWVAFNYKPFPSTFWPTNGSFDDVVIRLPKVFRDTSAHYVLNLSLLEMSIKGLQRISIPEQDEQHLGLDLDGDGQLTKTTQLQRRSHYIGQADNVAVLPLQYPVGTEFLHAVRYLATDTSGKLVPSLRMKELRYARKYKIISDAALRFAYNQEHREKDLEQLPKYAMARPIGKAGLNNKFGWQIQGWIENAEGALRPQSHEENFYCMGCHTSVGTTIDSTFAFPRKVTGAAGWGYIDLDGMVDAPNYGEKPVDGVLMGEIETYLRRVGGGDEFRHNTEMKQRWFDRDGELNADAVRGADVYQLITPSHERALDLNRAYIGLVQSQRFTRGRDAVMAPASHVYEHVDQTTAPVLPAERQFTYDLRLAWPVFEPSSSKLDQIQRSSQ